MDLWHHDCEHFRAIRVNSFVFFASCGATKLMETCRSSTTRRRIHNSEWEGVEIGVAERIIKHVRLRSDQTIKRRRRECCSQSNVIAERTTKKQVRAMLIASESRLNAKVGVIRHHVVRWAHC